MVHTRSGLAVVHMETSYGRAARIESKRRRKKQKWMNMDSIRSAAGDDDAGSKDTSTPNTTTTIMTPTRAMSRTMTRAQAQEDRELITPPGASRRVAETPPPPRERILRGTRLPRCSDYGLERHSIFKDQGFHFCSSCDLWDARVPDCNKTMSRVSTRYACTAGHTSFLHPTSIRKTHCSMHRGIKIADTSYEGESLSASV